MEAVGSILYREASRLAIAHPFFAPAVLDGGVTKDSTGEIAEQVMSGFLRAAETEKALKQQGASAGNVVADLTYPAGPKFAGDARKELQRLLPASKS
jgi:hypothetical protein